MDSLIKSLLKFLQLSLNRNGFGVLCGQKIFEEEFTLEDAAKIFIVEDEKHIARFIQINLEKAGFKTAIEHNGRRAYERIMQ